MGWKEEPKPRVWKISIFNVEMNSKDITLRIDPQWPEIYILDAEYFGIGGARFKAPNEHAAKIQALQILRDALIGYVDVVNAELKKLPSAG